MDIHSWKKRLLHPRLRHLKSIWIEFVCFQSNTASQVTISPNLHLNCGKFQSKIALFSQLFLNTDCSNDCTCPWRHASKCYCYSCGSDSCHHQLHPQEACCHWNFVVRKIHGGSSEDHTSSRPCFVEDGPTGLLHNFSGLDGVDEEFIWNDSWPASHQQPALDLQLLFL